jgi:serine/threonine protein kinase
MSVPQVLGPYQLKAKLAVGGQSEVWLAHRMGPGGFRRRCALKLLLPPIYYDDDARKSFMAEARLMAHFDHPNLVAITDLGESDDHELLYAVMPYVSGQSLATLMRQKEMRFDVETTLWIMSRVLYALDFAHNLSDDRGRRLDIVHRDVSPENVIVSFDGRVKLIDFGIALSSINPRNTRLHVVKGKIDYLSPEQAQASPAIAHTTDIYSAGLLMYAMLTGFNPLEGDDDSALQRAQNPDIPKITRHVRVPRMLAEAVHAMLQKVPERRPQRASDLARNLMSILHEIAPNYDEMTFSEFVKKSLSQDIRRENEFLRGLAGGTQIINTAPESQDVDEITNPNRGRGPSQDTQPAGRNSEPPPPPAPKTEPVAPPRVVRRRDQTTPIIDARELLSEDEASSPMHKVPHAAAEGLNDLFKELEEIYDD